MKITEKIKKNRPLLSIEIFPPKTPKGVENLKKKLNDYKSYSPDYISVTYGAGGTTRDGTVELCDYIQNQLGITTMAHLTCSGQTKDEIREIIQSLEKAGIQNIIALRGDPPKGESQFKVTNNGFAHGNELAQFISKEFDFGIACAGYPEGHIEATSRDTDIDYLKLKIDSGAQFIVTQFFLDNMYFFQYRDRIRKKGIHVPVIPGILPISNYSQITRFSLMCGCSIPAKVMKGLYGKSDADQEKFGLDHAAEQIRELMENDIDGVHLYALNKKASVGTLAPVFREKYPA